ncbi:MULTISPECIES: hypothetical protein [Xenorhabdus]|uniref:hypothetical protein n=1 Tax=Xenorhabdus TaxID=626 RepID=UPI0006461A99|nr:MULTISPECIES: hypothetical protein [Xenorhabdus]
MNKKSVNNKLIKLVAHNVTTLSSLFHDPSDETEENNLIKNEKLRRFYSTGTQKGVISARKALILAGLDIHDPKMKFGLYATQYGYLHPLPEELLPEDTQTQAKKQENSANSIFKTIWQSEQINPFLVTLSLSNNLLGVLSQELQVQCDCASFLRGNIGLLAALSEAELNLNSHLIDYALVVASGIGHVPQECQPDLSGEYVEFGVTFILTRVENTTPQDPTYLIDITHLNQHYRDKNYAAETLLFIKELAERIETHKHIESVN